MTDHDHDFPIRWDWKSNGSDVSGTFLRFNEGPTAYGRKPVLVLKVDGEPRSIWLLETALRSRLAEEVGRRESRNLDVGERIVISRGEKTRSKSTGNNVWPFRVQFPDAPARSALEILTADEPAPKPNAQSGDIPF